MSATGQDPETQVWLVRHGETEWSRDGRHTSSTDLPLTPEGEAVARTLKPRLAEVAFDLVLTSPMQRARVTADLAGFGDAEVDAGPGGVGLRRVRGPDHRGDPRGGARLVDLDAPGTRRRDARPGRPSASTASSSGVGNVPERALVFGHGHALRALTARWLGLPVTDGRLFRLDTATLSRLGYERGNRVILAWNS